MAQLSRKLVEVPVLQATGNSNRSGDLRPKVDARARLSDSISAISQAERDAPMGIVVFAGVRRNGAKCSRRASAA